MPRTRFHKHGERRVKTQFLLIPRTFLLPHPFEKQKELRWLTTESWIQEYNVYLNMWIDVCWTAENE